MNTDARESAEYCFTVFEAVETALKDFNFTDSNMQFNDLLSSVSNSLNIPENKQRGTDQLIRIFIERHSVYTSKRGAGGGITLRANEAKKSADLAARKAAKEAIKLELESKI